jgi:hypothetical protein
MVTLKATSSVALKWCFQTKLPSTTTLDKIIGLSYTNKNPYVYTLLKIVYLE